MRERAGNLDTSLCPLIETLKTLAQPVSILGAPHGWNTQEDPRSACIYIRSAPRCPVLQSPQAMSIMRERAGNLDTPLCPLIETLKRTLAQPVSILGAPHGARSFSILKRWSIMRESWKPGHASLPSDWNTQEDPHSACIYIRSAPRCPVLQSPQAMSIMRERAGNLDTPLCPLIETLKRTLAQPVSILGAPHGARSFSILKRWSIMRESWKPGHASLPSDWNTQEDPHSACIYIRSAPRCPVLQSPQAMSIMRESWKPGHASLPSDWNTQEDPHSACIYIRSAPRCPILQSPQAMSIMRESWKPGHASLPSDWNTQEDPHSACIYIRSAPRCPILQSPQAMSIMRESWKPGHASLPSDWNTQEDPHSACIYIRSAPRCPILQSPQAMSIMRESWKPGHASLPSDWNTQEDPHSACIYIRSAPRCPVLQSPQAMIYHERELETWTRFSALWLKHSRGPSLSLYLY